MIIIKVELIRSIKTEFQVDRCDRNKCEEDKLDHKM